MWTSEDKIFMQRAWDLALNGKGTTSPNPMVGAVVVRSRKIVGEGWHKKYGGPHAEVFALHQAGGRAQGAKLYVTLEPCSHFGQTPPCADLIISCGIKEVVVGMKDPNVAMNGQSLKKLQRAGINVKVGLFGPELQKMNESFVKYITTKRPFVVAKIAQTLDGKIATATGESQWITSAETREFTHRLRNEFDAILVGSNTVVQDNPRLNASAKRITKIVVDSTLKIPLRARLFVNTSPEDCLIATTKRASVQKIKSFQRKGVQVLVCPAKKKKVDLQFLMKELAKRNIATLLIEGGSQVIGRALKEKIVDKVHVFVAPKILGDQQAISSVRELNIRHLPKAIELKNVKWAPLGHDLWMEGYVR